MYPILLASEERSRRDDLISHLLQDGIESRPVFFPVYRLPPYGGSPGRCPTAEDLSARGICLPTHPRLTRRQIAYVGARVRAHLGV
jgi:perosamine synthetase